MKKLKLPFVFQMRELLEDAKSETDNLRQKVRLK